jgi:hypothetical protein
MTRGALIIRSFYGPDQINVSVEQTGLQRRRLKWTPELGPGIGEVKV